MRDPHTGLMPDNSAERVASFLEHRQAAAKKAGVSTQLFTMMQMIGYAPGTYNIKCVDCDAEKIGDKRSLICRECAIEHIASIGSEAQQLIPAPESEPMTATSVPYAQCPIDGAVWHNDTGRVTCPKCGEKRTA